MTYFALGVKVGLENSLIPWLPLPYKEGQCLAHHRCICSHFLALPTCQTLCQRLYIY
jgi:hypothetical protein